MELYLSMASFASKDLQHMEAEETIYDSLMHKYFTQQEIDVLELETLKQVTLDFWISVC